MTVDVVSNAIPEASLESVFVRFGPIADGLVAPPPTMTGVTSRARFFGRYVVTQRPLYH